MMLVLYKNILEKSNDDEIKRYEEEIQTNLQIISDLLANNNVLSVRSEELSQQVSNKLDSENKIKKIVKLETQIENNLNKYKKDIEFFKEQDDCPTCRQSIVLQFKEDQIQSLDTRVNDSKQALDQLKKKLNEEQERLNTINETQSVIQSFVVKIATNNTSINETNKYITKLQKKIDELRISKVGTEQEGNNLRVLEDSLSQLQGQIKQLVEEKSYLEAASVLLKDTGIKTKIVRQYLPVINKLVNKYLASLDFFVNFNLDESFKETIKSRHRDDFSYNNFSEGEKQRIDMALMLTWRAVAKLKNSANTNLLILDETFDSSLDANGTDYLMTVLHTLEGVNLFVISHKGDILQDKFENVIRFVKEKNFSKVIK